MCENLREHLKGSKNQGPTLKFWQPGQRPKGRCISKVDTILFTYLPFFIFFYLIPCHLDALKMSKSGLGLYNIHKL